MKEVVRVICENTNSTIYVDWGTRLIDMTKMLPMSSPYPFLAAYVNNSVKELDYRICEPVSVRFIDATHYEGIRVYHRTLFLTLHKAVHDLYPGCKLKIKHSVSKGFYAELIGDEILTEVTIGNIKARMQELVAQNLPIVREKMLSEEAVELYEKLGFEDKIELLKTRPHLYCTVYKLVDMVGYMYGALAPSTGFLTLFDLKPYCDGMHISVPTRKDPDQLASMIDQKKMFDVLEEYKAWVKVMGVTDIGSLNRKILDGKSGELIKACEAFHENKLANIAASINAARKERGVKMVLISGPSSSGKTTFTKRLGIQLMILGLKPVMMSLDDYFLPREQTPKDENGEYNYEAIDALDLPKLNSDLNTLFTGGSIQMPCYDFITGGSTEHDTPIEIGDDAVLLVEGIHALNPRLTAGIAENLKFKVYISALTSISMDDITRIHTTDTRLLRRMVRDYRMRGCSPADTLNRWASVRRGEEENIFPYQENADVMFNSALFYELPVLKPFAERLLYSVPDTEEVYGMARQLLKFLDNFLEIEPDEIPPTSILREFVGGSSFDY